MFGSNLQLAAFKYGSYIYSIVVYRHSAVNREFNVTLLISLIDIGHDS